MAARRCGGIGEVKEVDEALLSILANVDNLLRLVISQKRNGKEPETLEPISYKTQVVAGTNYFVNLRIGEQEYIHARIYRDLDGAVLVHSITDLKTENEEIAYF